MSIFRTVFFVRAQSRGRFLEESRHFATQEGAVKVALAWIAESKAPKILVYKCGDDGQRIIKELRDGALRQFEPLLCLSTARRKAVRLARAGGAS